MSLLIITPDMRSRIKEIINYSSENLISIASNTIPRNAGRDPNHCITIPFGVRCVYSQEIQKGVMLRHFSMSVDKKNRYPSPVAVDLMLEEFGFRNRIRSERIVIWQDDDNQAINCLETMDEVDDPKIFKSVAKTLGYH